MPPLQVLSPATLNFFVVSTGNLEMVETTTEGEAKSGGIDNHQAALKLYSGLNDNSLSLTQYQIFRAIHAQKICAIDLFLFFAFRNWMNFVHLIIKYFSYEYDWHVCEGWRA